jgi:hypothetical protein
VQTMRTLIALFAHFQREPRPCGTWNGRSNVSCERLRAWCMHYYSIDGMRCGDTPLLSGSPTAIHACRQPQRPPMEPDLSSEKRTATAERNGSVPRQALLAGKPTFIHKC